MGVATWHFLSLSPQTSALRVSGRIEGYDTDIGAKLRSREASINSFCKSVNSAQGQLVQAQTTSLNPRIRNVVAAGLRTQLGQTRLKLAAAEADVANARADRLEIQTRIADLNIIGCVAPQSST